jgi:hypothetical protein
VDRASFQCVNAQVAPKRLWMSSAIWFAKRAPSLFQTAKVEATNISLGEDKCRKKHSPFLKTANLHQKSMRLLDGCLNMDKKRFDDLSSNLNVLALYPAARVAVQVWTLVFLESRMPKVG